MLLLSQGGAVRTREGQLRAAGLPRPCRRTEGHGLFGTEMGQAALPWALWGRSGDEKNPNGIFSHGLLIGSHGLLSQQILEQISLNISTGYVAVNM